MDYSTISNKTNITEAEDLTGGEITEKYYLLRKQYENLSSNYDSIKQELHDTRRSYQTALDVQSHLNAELESCQADEQRRRTELNSRITALQEDISALRQDRTDLLEHHSNEIKQLQIENKRLRDEQLVVARESPVRDTSEFDELRIALSSMTSEAAVVKVALEEARAELVPWQMKVEELVTEVAELRAAADIRREELSAAGEREAAALADLAEARALLHQVDSQDLQPHAAKGNSLFAEVDDKRQEMAKNLIQMKQTNSRLRRELANKQAELEALLHEKQTIWEQQAGAAAHYDRELIENYEERITQLEGLCERQRRELSRWFGKLCEPTAQGWLPGVLDHLKTECEQLRLEVLSRGAAQLASAAQVRELRRKIAHLTANNTKQSPIQSQIDKVDISVQKITVPIKKPAVDDVKKKVSFN
ncbi:protein Spindly [Pararge aegeria]|uniref:Jg13971 protein n=2 Tax=Pararge aegeria TaxID=116150 RepID=A0A8S4RAN1_9NEOP|nr:protein Spindly [Pararge aegeria]CAH2233106.1 jg13971 [Pararge aegeria aegeria]